MKNALTVSENDQEVELKEEINMSVIEIGKLCGKGKSTIHKWIENATHNETKNVSNNGTNNFIIDCIKHKVEMGKKGSPAKFNLDEAIYIIRDGGKNELLANLLQENVDQKDQRDKYDMFLSSITTNIESIAKEAVDKKMIEMEDTVKALNKEVKHSLYKTDIIESSITRLNYALSSSGILNFLEDQKKSKYRFIWNEDEDQTIFESLQQLPQYIKDSKKTEMENEIVSLQRDSKLILRYLRKIYNQE